MAGFDDDSNNPTKPKGPDFTYASPSSARDDLRGQEQSPVDSGSSGGDVFGYLKNQGKNPARTPAKTGFMSATRTKVIAAVAGVGITALLTLGSLAPAAVASFLEVIVPDLTTATATLARAHTSLLALKTKLLGNTKAVSGCTVLSIRCKLKTMSKAQVARYDRAGFKVEYESTKIPGRVQPKSIQYKDTVYTDPEEFMAAIGKNTNGIRTADIRANNMEYLSTTFGRFTEVVLNKFGITKSKPGLKGTTQDRVNQLLTGTSTANAADLNFVKQVDSNGKETGRYTLVGDPKGTTYSESEVTKMKASIAKVVKVENRPSVQKLRAVQTTGTFTTMLKAASITGAADVACSLNNMVGQAATAAKTSTIQSIIQRWQPIFAIMQSIKTPSPADSSDIAAVGEIITKVDTRAEVANPDGSGGSVPNPNFNSTALTSPLVSMSANGTVRDTTAETDQFTSGLSVQKLLGPVGGAYVYFNQLLTSSACKVVQNWLVRGVSLVVGVVAAIGTAGGELAVQAGVVAALAGAMYVVNVALNNAINGPDLTDLFNSGSTEAIGSSGWLAYATMSGSQAASVGLAPGNKANIQSYQTAMTSVNNDYAALEKENAASNPLDVSNQYSFLGSMARTYGAASNYSTTPISVVRSIVALVTGQVTSSSQTAYAQTSYSAERYSKCADPAQQVAGYDGDVGCNIRYVEIPGDAELKMDPDGTAKWMEDNGYVEKNTTTGLPAGYTMPNTGQEQSALVGAVTGAANSFVNQFVNTRAASYGNNDYAMYLDYCAYRTLPYGEQYSEESGINGVAAGWLTGKTCSENSAKLNHFRAYTTIVAAQQVEDEESFDSPAATTQDTSSTGTGSIPVVGTTSWPLSVADWPGDVFDCDFRYQSEGGTVHTGIDISVAYKPVYAAVDGIISLPDAGMVDIEFKDATGKIMYFNYQHLSQRVDANGAPLTNGQQIKAGDKIGVSGMTNTTSPHLHISLWDVPIVSGHHLPTSPLGATALSHMWHPLSILPANGRPAPTCGSAPYHVPGGH